MEYSLQHNFLYFLPISQTRIVTGHSHIMLTHSEYLESECCMLIHCSDQREPASDRCHIQRGYHFLIVSMYSTHRERKYSVELLMNHHSLYVIPIEMDRIPTDNQKMIPPLDMAPITCGFSLIRAVNQHTAFGFQVFGVRQHYM